MSMQVRRHTLLATGVAAAALLSLVSVSVADDHYRRRHVDTDRANVDARPTNPAPAEASPRSDEGNTGEKKGGKTDEKGMNTDIDPDRPSIPNNPNKPR